MSPTLCIGFGLSVLFSDGVDLGHQLDGFGGRQQIPLPGADAEVVGRFEDVLRSTLD